MVFNVRRRARDASQNERFSLGRFDGAGTLRPMSLNREQEELLRQLAVEKGWITTEEPNNGRPQLKLPADDREIHDFARELGEIAAKTKLLFRRGERAVTVNEETKSLTVMSSQAFRTWIADFAACYREKAAGETKVRKIRTMNVDTATAVLEAKVFWKQLPEIRRLNSISLPIVRADGRIERLAPGYFAEQGIYTLPDGLTMEEEMPLKEAKAILDELHEFFPYKTSRSKAASLAAMLTLYCAAMLPAKALRPAFTYTANTKGAGKTLNAKVAIIPVVGSCAPRSMPRKEEAKKVLDVVAMDASIYVLFDNIKGKIQGEEIESFITAAQWEARPLGESAKIVAENSSTVFLTGNQSTMSEDMADRCLLIELFVEEADNRDRSIPRVIDDAYLEAIPERSRICSALWSLVRAWDAADRPESGSLLPRFEKWSRVVPAIIAYAGYGDAIERAEIRGVGDELNDMRSLLRTLAPDGEATSVEKEFAQLIGAINEADLFEDMQMRSRRDDALLDQNGKPTMAARAAFGKLFERYDGRLFRFPDMCLRFRIHGKGEERRFIISLE
jgi:hypothetical protein